MLNDALQDLIGRLVRTKADIATFLITGSGAFLTEATANLIPGSETAGAIGLAAAAGAVGLKKAGESVGRRIKGRRIPPPAPPAAEPNAVERAKRLVERLRSSNFENLADELKFSLDLYGDGQITEAQLESDREEVLAQYRGTLRAISLEVLQGSSG